MRHQTNRGVLGIRCAALVDLLALSLVARTQTTSSNRTERSRSVPSYQAEQSQSVPWFSGFNPLQAQRLEETYHPITPSERFRWFVMGTVGPAHLAGVAFLSAGGTAVNRPAEYGPHWMGFAHRFGINMVGSAAANAVEASAGLLLQEDPRYFRASQLPFKARVQNVVRLTFLAKGANRSFEPAYTRYAGIVGSNFPSNAWRVHSVANVQSALLRSSEGFAGRMATNAFAEFGPDVKHIFHPRNRATQPSPKKAD